MAYLDDVCVGVPPQLALDALRLAWEELVLPAEESDEDDDEDEVDGGVRVHG